MHFRSLWFVHYWFHHLQLLVLTQLSILLTHEAVLRFVANFVNFAVLFVDITIITTFFTIVTNAFANLLYVVIIVIVDATFIHCVFATIITYSIIVSNMQNDPQCELVLYHEQHFVATLVLLPKVVCINQLITCTVSLFYACVLRLLYIIAITVANLHLEQWTVVFVYSEHQFRYTTIQIVWDWLQRCLLFHIFFWSIWFMHYLQLRAMQTVCKPMWQV